MDGKQTMAALLRQLKPLPRSVAIEAVYLVVRCLSHGWTKDDFLTRTEAGTKLAYQQEAAELVPGIISMIEHAEGMSVSLLPDPIRLRYKRQLTNSILASGGKNKVNRGEVDAALRELRRVA
ncbi:MAG: hypothetical protein EXR07_16100 [Acetobacteraceae bacterium]|nr:hypothetical protein [Acetobacteraceae bacterium]